MEERQARWGRHRLACYKGTCPWCVVRPTRVGDGWLGEPCAGNACVTAPSTWEARGGCPELGGAGSREYQAALGKDTEPSGLLTWLTACPTTHVFLQESPIRRSPPKCPLYCSQGPTSSTPTPHILYERRPRRPQDRILGSVFSSVPAAAGY